MSHVDEGQIQAYLDRQLEFADEAERKRLEYHISKCLVCAKLLNEAEEVQERSTSLLDLESHGEVVPPPFEEVVKRAEKTERAVTQRRRFSNLTRLAWAASVVLAVGTGIYVRPYLTKDHTEAPGEGASSPREGERTNLASAPGERNQDVPGSPENDSGVPSNIPPNPERVVEAEGFSATVPSGMEADAAEGPGADETDFAGSESLADRVEKAAAPSETREKNEVGAAREREGIQTSQTQAVATRPLPQPTPMPPSARARQTAGAPVLEENRAPARVGMSNLADISWRPGNLEDATRHLGQPALIIPGFEVRRVFLSQAETKVAMIVQVMEDGTRITLWELINTEGPEAGRDPPSDISGNHADIVTKGLWITAWAPLSTGAIRTLLDRLTEAPDSN